MLTRVRSPRSGRPSEGNAVATSAHDRLRGASSAPDSRTAPCRHAGSGTKRGNGDRRVATYPRGARGSASPAPSRSHAQANGQSRRGNPSSSVFVLDRHHLPLMPCHPARARMLLQQGRAVVVRPYPFTIRLRDRVGGVCQPLVLGIDPGSKATGLAVAREDGATRHAVWLGELHHRGAQIRKKLGQRRAYRRRRRSAYLRYRAPRFQNRRRPVGWLPPSLRHRVETTIQWVTRLRRWLPISRIALELVRFDTQALQQPEISGVEYQQGTLYGYEIREYLLEKWGRHCVYCQAMEIPLQIEHLIPKSRGGSNRVSNLTLACVRCNQRKGNQTAEEYGFPQLQAQAKQPLHDAAAVNNTRWTLYQALHRFELPVTVGSGGRTKWNRHRFGISKTHALDALCVGEVEGIALWPSQTLQISATGRGAYQRTRVTAQGFPRGYLMPTKSSHGFRTGDLVRATVPIGKHRGTHQWRVAIRASGSFNLKTVDRTLQGIAHRYCRLLMRADGYAYQLTSITEDAPPLRPHGQGFRREV